MKRINNICLAILFLGSFACTAVNIEVVSEMESGYQPARVRPKAPIDPKELPNAPVIGEGPNPGFQACPAKANGINMNAVAIPQHTDVWCWAASAEMVMQAHGTDVNQCSIVNRVHNGDVGLSVGVTPFCCGENGFYPVACWINGWPDQAFERYEYNWDFTDGPLTEEQVKGQLCNTGPFIYVLLYYEGKGGHSIVVKDFQVIDGELVLLVHDHLWIEETNPRKPTPVYPISYSEFRDGVWEVARYNHAFDYVQISPKPR